MLLLNQFIGFKLFKKKNDKWGQFTRFFIDCNYSSKSINEFECGMCINLPIAI